MSSQRRTAGTGTTTGAEPIDWTNPSGITGNTSDAEAAPTIYLQETKVLLGTNFGFSIPVGSTIDGIKFYLIGRLNDASFSADASRIQLTLVGQDKQGDGSLQISGTTDTEYSTGGATDLWLLTPTPGDINDSGFGINIRYRHDTSTGGDMVIYVKNFELEIFYTEPPQSQAPRSMHQYRQRRVAA